MAPVDDVLNQLRSRLGLSGYNEIHKWYNANVENLGAWNWAWCAATVSFAYAKAGYGDLFRPRAYVPFMAQDAQARANGTTWRARATGMQPGDLVVFEWSGGASTNIWGYDHVGICEQVLSGGRYAVLEGNTNGGVLARVIRDATYIAGHVRPDWARAGVAKTVWRHGDTGDKVREIQRIVGLTGSDVDGDWGPVTTAAVKAWQLLRGLDADGAWGPLCEAASKTPTPTPPAPAPDGQVAVITAGNVLNADALVKAADAAGVPLHVAVAVTIKESGGQNIYGHDRGGVFSSPAVYDGPATDVKGNNITVTQTNFERFEKRVAAGETSNGVGPAQITYPGYFPQARKDGLKLWVPYDNYLFGFRLFKKHLDAFGGDVAKAGARYNGGGNPPPAAVQYGASLAAIADTWRRKLDTIPPPPPVPTPTHKPVEGDVTEETGRQILRTLIDIFDLISPGKPGVKFDGDVWRLLQEIKANTAPAAADPPPAT